MSRINPSIEKKAETHSSKSFNPTVGFEQIWMQNYMHLSNFIGTKVPANEQDDILQDVGIAVFNQLNRGGEIRNAKSWIFQVARNIIADHYKAKAKSQEGEKEFFNIEFKSFKPCVCDIIEQIIESVLPDKYSQALILSDIQKLSQKEIAKQLGLNYVTTKSRIQRARRMMKEAFVDSIDFKLNEQGQILGGKLKSRHNLPAELVQQIKLLELED